MKTITQASTGKTFKMGARRPHAPGPRFRMRNYLQASLPVPPAGCTYISNALPALREMYGNDQVGDCVPAGLAHLIGILTGNAGALVKFLLAQVLAFYTAVTGYVPGDESTDNGTDPEAALNYLQKNGFAQGLHKIAAWMEVDGSNWEELQQTIYLFEHVLFAIALPSKWVAPMPEGDGFLWDVAGEPVPDNGHFFIGFAYQSKTVQIDTWAMLGSITRDAIAKYAVPAAGGACYVALSQEIIDKAKQRAPNGFAWAQLMADFQSMKV